MFLSAFLVSLERLLCLSAAARIRFLETLFAAQSAIASAFFHARHIGYDFLTIFVLGIRQGFSGTRCHEGRSRGCLFSPELIFSYSISNFLSSSLFCVLDHVTFSFCQIVSGLRVCWNSVGLPFTPCVGRKIWHRVDPVHLSERPLIVKSVLPPVVDVRLLSDVSHRKM